jgi:hypothetical protein
MIRPSSAQAASSSRLYLGLDLQQAAFTATVLDDALNEQFVATVVFDKEFPEFGYVL